MKKNSDDIANWRLQQENMARPFSYVFPQIPPRFRRCRALASALLLLEWSCCLLMFLSGLPLLGILVVTGKASFQFLLDENTLLAFLTVIFMGSIPLIIVCRLLRHAPKFFWHCPACGLPFPYYAPPIKGADVLKNADCLYTMDHLHIQYIKTKLCPLIVPSVCPACRCKFFDMADGNKDNFSI